MRRFIAWFVVFAGSLFALWCLWEISRNGRYQLVAVGMSRADEVIVVDTRTGEWVKTTVHRQRLAESFAHQWNAQLEADQRARERGQ